jgi:hypothetical protein
MNISPFLSTHHPCDETLRWVTEQLTEAGLRHVQTFDLHTARVATHNCSCPHHETDECDCQMVVLLVYGKAEVPFTLIVHGNNGQTWLSIADGSQQTIDSQLINTIHQALELTDPQSNASS